MTSFEIVSDVTNAETTKGTTAFDEPEPFRAMEHSEKIKLERGIRLRVGVESGLWMVDASLANAAAARSL